MKKKTHLINSPSDFLKPWLIPNGAELVYSERYYKIMEMYQKGAEESERERISRRKAYYKKRTEDISDSYVKKLLGKTNSLPAKAVDENPELIELTRLTLKTKRILKQKHNI